MPGWTPLPQPAPPARPTPRPTPQATPAPQRIYPQQHVLPQVPLPQVPPPIMYPSQVPPQGPAPHGRAQPSQPEAYAQQYPPLVYRPPVIRRTEHPRLLYQPPMYREAPVPVPMPAPPAPPVLPAIDEPATLPDLPSMLPMGSELGQDPAPQEHAAHPGPVGSIAAAPIPTVGRTSLGARISWLTLCLAVLALAMAAGFYLNGGG